MNAVTKASSLRANPNPIDPDVKVPAAVLRAKEAAEAAQRAAYPDQNPAEPPATPPVNPDTIQIAEPPAAPVAPSVATPEPAPQPAPVTPQGNEPPAAGSIEEWIQKFRSSEGRRRALEAQLATTNDRFALLEQEVEQLRNRPAPTAPTPPQRLITEQEEAEFGPEMLDVMARRAKETISPELAELRSMMGTLQQRLEGTSTALVRSARETMLSTLDSTLPEWRKINVTDEFKSWLALSDPYFGVSRLSALTKAYEQNDTARVLNFFKGFVSELAAEAPATDVTVTTPPAQPQPAKPSLESLAAPGRARTSAQPNAPAEKQYITTADIDAFYAAKRKGAYAGREAEADALERELFQAQRDGRVVKV